MHKNHLLLAIVVLLVVVVGFLAYDRHQKDRSPVERIADSVSESVDDIQDRVNRR